MTMIVDGVWRAEPSLRLGHDGWEPRREPFRDLVTADGSSGLPASAGRYHLIGCPGCPHAHRVALARKLKGLEDVVTLSEVRPVMTEHGREFGIVERATPDPVSGYRYLYEVYVAADSHYTGRASTPVLWDRQRKTIVSNNTDDIFAMLNRAFDALASARFDFRPDALCADIDQWKRTIYERFVSVVYKCGFAADQETYDRATETLVAAFDELEERLGQTPFLLGDQPTEADWMLFASLVRYDAIYHVLFRCTARRVADSPNLSGYVSRLLAIPGVAETFDLHQTMRHYYLSHRHINPRGIVPQVPSLPYMDLPRIP